MEEKLRVRKKFIINFLYWGIIAALVFLVLKYFIPLALPFFIALIAASVARPIARWLSSTTKKRRGKDGTVTIIKKQHPLAYNLAAVLSVIILYLLLIGLLTVILVPLISTAEGFASRLPALYTDTVRPALSNYMDRFDTFFDGLSEPIAAAAEQFSSELLSSLGSVAVSLSTKLLAFLSSTVTSLPSYLLKAVICLIASIFLAVDFEKLIEFFRLNLPEKTVRVVSDITGTLTGIVWHFLRSYFIIFLITCTEITVGLLLIGQSNALLIAVLIGIFDAFPIVGSGMILLPWSVITMLTGSLSKGIKLFFVYAFVVGIRQFLEPKIVGQQVGVRPIVTLFGMYVGGKLFGALGFFGLPITAAILARLNREKGYALFRLPGQKRKNTEEPPAAPCSKVRP